MTFVREREELGKDGESENGFLGKSLVCSLELRSRVLWCAYNNRAVHWISGRQEKECSVALPEKAQRSFVAQVTVERKNSLFVTSVG